MDYCLLCGRALPPRRWWQRLIGMGAPTCQAAGLDEVACRRELNIRVGVPLSDEDS